MKSYCAMLDRRLRLFGSALSPFSMKAALCLDVAGIDYRWLPEDGSRLEVWAVTAKLLAKRVRPGRLVFPRDFDPDRDELPLVPYLLFGDGQVGYDSTAIGHWVADQPGGQGLVPNEPLARFVCAVIDEAFDELGLYLLHHHRWAFSARTTRAGDMLAEEARPGVGPLAGMLGRRFAARQVRRLPYLFSVADADAPGDVDRLPMERRPPSLPGFPPTHALLEELMLEQLDALEHALTRSPFLLGASPTLADASVYGQLVSHTRMDPEADALMRSRAPRTHEWVCALRDAPPLLSSLGDDAIDLSASTELDDALAPLLRYAAHAMTLLRQNAAACARVSGDAEAGFEDGTALYDGVLAGHPYRAAARRFQLKVWERLLAGYRSLDRDAQARLSRWAPALSVVFDDA